MGDETPAADVAPRRFGPWRREVRAFLELLALTGIAVVQPVLDILGKNAGLFVTLRTSRIEAIALALIVVLVPPLILWILEVAIGVGFPRARRYAHAVIAAVIIAVIAVEVIKKQTVLSPSRLVVLAVPLGAIGGFLVLRFQVMRLWLRYLAIAPVIFAVLFLASSPVTAVVFENGTATAENVKIRKPNRIVMIVMDELPLESLLDGNGHVDRQLFPHFAALASTSTWFRNHTTVAPYTDEAVPALLTGDYPTGDYKPPVASEYPNNLFTLLGGTYGMNVHEAVTHLCPTGTCAGGAANAESSFTELLETTYTLWSEFASPERPTSATLDLGDVQEDPDPLGTGAAFVASLQPSGEPQLDFLHVMLPHQPWHLRATGQDDGRLDHPRGMYLDLVWNDAWTAMSGRQRHLLQVQAADRLLGDVIAKLKRIGAYEDTVIVVTADHGVAFTAQHSIRGAANETYPQILWTPMFLRAPGQTTGSVEDHPVRTIDVVPTIADVIDATVPWKVDGRSMFEPTGSDPPVRLFSWELNEVQPPAGREYVTFPSAPGFAAALRGRASSAAGDPDLRLYRTGAYGDLIGQRVDDFADAARGPAGSLDDAARFDQVDPGAEMIPWTYVEGRVNLAKNGAPMAISVNGVIAGLSASALENAFATRADFWATLPPQMFRRGRNDIGVHLIEGTPETPRLVTVRLA